MQRSELLCLIAVVIVSTLTLYNMRLVRTMRSLAENPSVSSGPSEEADISDAPVLDDEPDADEELATGFDEPSDAVEAPVLEPTEDGLLAKVDEVLALNSEKRVRWSGGGEGIYKNPKVRQYDIKNTDSVIHPIQGSVVVDYEIWSHGRNYAEPNMAQTYEIVCAFEDGAWSIINVLEGHEPPRYQCDDLVLP